MRLGDIYNFKEDYKKTRDILHINGMVGRYKYEEEKICVRMNVRFDNLYIHDLIEDIEHEVVKSLNERELASYELHKERKDWNATERGITMCVTYLYYLTRAFNGFCSVYEAKEEIKKYREELSGRESLDRDFFNAMVTLNDLLQRIREAVDLNNDFYTMREFDYIRWFVEDLANHVTNDFTTISYNYFRIFTTLRDEEASLNIIKVVCWFAFEIMIKLNCRLDELYGKYIEGEMDV